MENANSLHSITYKTTSKKEPYQDLGEYQKQLPQESAFQVPDNRLWNNHNEKDYEEGRLHTQEDVDKLVEQWLS